MSVAITNKIKPVFQHFSDVEMLQKCLHGMIQPSHMELLSKKHIYFKTKIVKMAVSSAIINYNDGFLSINYVFDSLGFPAGRYFFFNANQKDYIRLKNMGRKSLEKTEKRRKTLRSQRKGLPDLEKKNEREDTYRPGEY